MRKLFFYLLLISVFMLGAYLWLVNVTILPSFSKEDELGAESWNSGQYTEKPAKKVTKITKTVNQAADGKESSPQPEESADNAYGDLKSIADQIY